MKKLKKSLTSFPQYHRGVYIKWFAAREWRENILATVLALMFTCLLALMIFLPPTLALEQRMLIVILSVLIIGSSIYVAQYLMKQVHSLRDFFKVFGCYPSDVETSDKVTAKLRSLAEEVAGFLHYQGSIRLSADRRAQPMLKLLEISIKSGSADFAEARSLAQKHGYATFSAIGYQNNNDELRHAIMHYAIGGS